MGSLSATLSMGTAKSGRSLWTLASVRLLKGTVYRGGDETTSQSTSLHIGAVTNFNGISCQVVSVGHTKCISTDLLELSKNNHQPYNRLYKKGCVV